jgi:hypothetical protein
MTGPMIGRDVPESGLMFSQLGHVCAKNTRYTR